MGNNNYGLYWKGSKQNKSLQKKNKYYIIDQKSLNNYKRQIKRSNNSNLNQIDDNSVVTISKRDNILKPVINIVSKVEDDSETVQNVQVNHSNVDSLNECTSQLNNVNKYPNKISKWAKMKMEYQQSESNRISEIKENKKMKRKLRKNRIETAKLLTAKTKKGQPIIKNVMKHILNKLQK